MRLSYKFFVVSIFFSCAVKAQLKDTMHIHQNIFHESVYDQLSQNPIFFTNWNIKDFTQTQLAFQKKELNFKRVQTANQITDFTFSTKGIYNVKPKLRLLGNVDFTKAYEKGLGYNFSTERTENQNVLSPNYFFASKKGDWEHQHYFLQGGASYAATSNWLMSGIAFYKNSRSFRSIDPRPQIALSDYGAEITLGYKIKKHTLTAGTFANIENETGSVIYVDDTQNAPVYTETFTQFSSGYGRVVFNNSYNNYIFRTFNRSFKTGYQFQNKQTTLNALYSYRKAMEDMYGKDANGNTYLEDDLIRFKYRMVEHQSQLSYFFDGLSHDYKLVLNYNKQQGDNFSVAENGQNYRMTADKIQLLTGILKKEGNQFTNYAFEFGFNYQQQQFIDLLGSTNKKLNTLDIFISANKDFKLKKQQLLNLAFSFNYYQALDESLSLVATTTNTSFTDNVVRPDHAFDVTSKLNSKIALNYFIPLQNSKTLRIFATSNFLNALDNKYQKYFPIENKMNNYFSTGIALVY